MPPRRTGQGASGLVLRVGRIGVDVIVFVGMLRFGRSSLHEEDGEEYERAHLQEFALPVLEHRFVEMAGAEVPEVADGWTAVLLCVVVVDVPARQALSREEREEQDEARDGETVVGEEPAEPRSSPVAVSSISPRGGCSAAFGSLELVPELGESSVIERGTCLGQHLGLFFLDVV